MKKAKKIMCLALSLAVAGSVLAGCGNKGGDTGPNGNPKIKYWAPFYTHYSKSGTSMGDATFFKELQKRVGVDIEFIHPAAGQEGESFNLMTASGDLPDVIEYSFLGYKGGPEKAIADKVIIDMTPYMEEKAPNLTNQLKTHPEWDKQVKTDSGKYYCFPAIRGDAFLCYWTGPQMRQDYLDKVNMERPETIDEWEKVLTAFKTQLNIETPLTLANGSLAAHNCFIGAYGVTPTFFLKDGEVTYGPMTDGYEQYLRLFNKWIQEGLLDPDYATHDAKTFDAQVASGKAGAYVNSVGGGMGKFITATKQQNPEAKLTAVKFPVLNKGDEPTIGFKEFDYIPGQSVSVTTACKNLDAAFKLLDYAYDGDGQPGYMFYNFGIEGESYNMIYGYPTYTDEIVHPTDGKTMMHALTEYNRAAVLGPMIQDKRYFEQYMVNPEQKETAEIWKLAGDASYRMPNVTYTVEEAGQITSKMNEITSYVNEMEIKFIMGTEPLSNLEAFRQHLKDMGLDEVTEINKAAVARYNAR